MSKTIKKLLSLLLCATLLCGVLPLLTVHAEDNPTSGTCGENLTWTYDTNTANLTISGEGAMKDYFYNSYKDPITTAPWKVYYRSLKTVIINDGVTSIGEYAFSGCTGLIGVTIGNSVTIIGEDAFYQCTGLTNITIPDSVTSIGSGSFIGTPYYNDINNWQDGCLYLGHHLIEVDSALTGSCEIKSGTKYIAGGAFFECFGLTSVTIPDSVTCIGSLAFFNFTGLTSITIPDSVTSIGEGAFAYCTRLTSVTIGNSVTSIGDYAFYQCTELTSVTIPASVTSIGFGVFAYCTELMAIVVEANNPNYSSDSFGVLYNKNKTELVEYPVGNTRTSFIIPSSVKSIDNYAFYCCTELTSVIIPDSVTSIGSYAFGGCTGLTNVTIPDSVTSIGGWAFDDCTGLTSVTIGNSVTSIGSYAFAGCTGLTSVTIGNSVTSIGSYAFAGCTGLISITIPDSVTSIDYRAFEYCTGLTSVTIPDSVTYIDSDAFYGASDDFVIFGFPGSYAEEYANENGITFIPMDNTPYVTLHCPQQTDSASFEARGIANPYQTVSVYDGDDLLGTAVADGTGKWSGSFTLNAPADRSAHTIIAKVTVDGETVSAEKTMVYDTNATYPAEFTLTHNGKTIDCLNARVFNLSVNPSYPMTFKVKLNRSVTGLWITSTKGSEVNRIRATYDSAAGAWNAEGWFDPANHSYVPGTLGVEVNDGKTLQFESARISFLIDPSGYVYEAVKSNRVEGATAVIFHQQGETAVLWDANRYEQDNPQTTDSLGAYHWDVTEGDWRVRVIKAGYETAYSDWMGVPPEWTEVAIPLVNKAAPTVESMEKDGGRYVLTFSRYMDFSTVTTENITFNDNVSYTIEPLDKEVSGTDGSVYYARTFALTPAAAVTDITVKNVKSYAGTAMEDEFTQELKAAPTVYTLTYNANSGTGAPADQTGNGTITLSTAKPTRDGYTFKGWATSASATAAQYAAGASFDLTANTTLYAVWQKNDTPPAQPKIRSVSLGDATVNFKSKTTLKPQITADDGAKYTVSYSSSDPSIVKVNEKTGEVTGTKKGTATITCTVTDEYGNTVSDTCKVTVNYTAWQWVIIILLFGWIWYI